MENKYQLAQGKTTICGLSLDEAIPVIELYKQLKITTHQLKPIEDLMMGTRGQYYINGKSIQELLDRYDTQKNNIKELNKVVSRLDKALDKALELIIYENCPYINEKCKFEKKECKKCWKEYLLKETETKDLFVEMGIDNRPIFEQLEEAFKK